MSKSLIISTSIDLVRVIPERIVCISSDGNYSNIMLSDGQTRLVSFQLGQIEKMLSEQLDSHDNSFIRIGKSLIINRSYISYINIPKQQLILSDYLTINHTVSASREALRQLKELVEHKTQ